MANSDIGSQNTVEHELAAESPRMRHFVYLSALSLILWGLAGCKAIGDALVELFIDTLFIDTAVDSAVNSNYPSRNDDVPERYRKRFEAQQQQDRFLRESRR